MEIEITVNIGEIGLTRQFQYKDSDEAHAQDWNEKVSNVIDDLQDYIKDKWNT